MKPSLRQRATHRYLERRNWINYARNTYIINALVITVGTVHNMCVRFTSSCPPLVRPRPERRRCRRRWTCPGECHVWSHLRFPPLSPAPCGTDTTPGRTAPRAPAAVDRHYVTIMCTSRARTHKVSLHLPWLQDPVRSQSCPYRLHQASPANIWIIMNGANLVSADHKLWSYVDVVLTLKHLYCDWHTTVHLS